MAVSYDQIYSEEYKKNLGNSVANLEAAQKTGEESLLKNKAQSLNTLKQAYDNSASTLLKNKDKALKEAYISKMKEQKDLPSILARQGLGGGVSETTTASLMRNYQNNRNSAEENYGTNKTNLDTQYGNDIAQVETGYNTDLANLKSSYASQIENAKQNAISLALSSASQRYNALAAEEAAAQQAALASAGGGGSKAPSASSTPVPEHTYSENITTQAKKVQKAANPTGKANLVKTVAKNGYKTYYYDNGLTYTQKIANVKKK